ncbi:hypothetical protein Vadar_004274 [Vaccinium darrowii]|uniref:Uncharacterized protein n=1 Tax=Vaccinium darrowii TaxID=229202 RepID=A0ACB7XF78_9ERIC|nr:hypothetical protein Vadar_004274 [Vaccinium darrowii]
MGTRARGGFQRPQEVPRNAPVAIKIGKRRTVDPIPGRLGTCNQCGLTPDRGHRAKTNLLYFSGRISTWSVELSQYDIDFQPRTAIKGQELADFVVEFTPSEVESPTVREYEPSPQGDDQNAGS